MNPTSITNPPITPVAGATTAGDASTSVASELTHAVLVSGEIEARLKQTLQDIFGKGGDVSAGDLLRLQYGNSELSVWTNLVSGSIQALFQPLKDAAGKLA